VDKGKKEDNVGKNSTRHCKNNKPVTRSVFETPGSLTAVENARDHCRWIELLGAGFHQLM
jgi:hypothetical protein